jgi:hypothetical protein
MTGSTQIVGDVAVSPMGTTVGTLPGARQPPHLPVAGSVMRKSGFLLPAVDTQVLESSFAPFKSFLNGGHLPASSPTLAQLQAEGSSGALATIPDSIESIYLSGDVPFNAKLIRHESPLVVYIQGSLTIESRAHVEGVVAFHVTRAARIERGAIIDNMVVMCGDSIRVEGGVTMRGQLIAPLIRVGENCVFSYPSILCSYDFSAIKGQRIEFASGDRLEGMVILFRGAGMGQAGSHTPQNLVVLSHDATIVGALYAEGPATLDGTVIGSVIVEDLFFYQAPTSYFGWLRSARINRQILPEGFVVPQALGMETGEVVVWM